MLPSKRSPSLLGNASEIWPGMPGHYKQFVRRGRACARRMNSGLTRAVSNGMSRRLTIEP